MGFKRGLKDIMVDLHTILFLSSGRPGLDPGVSLYESLLISLKIAETLKLIEDAILLGLVLVARPPYMTIT